MTNIWGYNKKSNTLVKTFTIEGKAKNFEVSIVKNSQGEESWYLTKQKCDAIDLILKERGGIFLDVNGMFTIEFVLGNEVSFNVLVS